MNTAANVCFRCQQRSPTPRRSINAAIDLVTVRGCKQKGRNAPVAVTVGLFVLAAVFVVIAVIYFTESADALPSFFPGHRTGSSTHHTKHGLVAVILAALCLIGAWFTTGRRGTSTPTQA